MILTRQATTFICVIQAWIRLLHKRALKHNFYRRVTYGPMLARYQGRIANLKCIFKFTDVEVVQMLQMRRAPFFELVKSFREGLLEDNIHISVKEQVVMFLPVVGHNQRFRVIHNTFTRSIETISCCFKQDLFEFGELKAQLMLLM